MKTFIRIDLSKGVRGLIVIDGDYIAPPGVDWIEVPHYGVKISTTLKRGYNDKYIDGILYRYYDAIIVQPLEPETKE